jgi:hypothetical protein
MKIISLDQNAISNLAFPPNAKWEEMLRLMRAGVKSERMLCPTPAETITESVHLSASERKLVEEICRDLSNGYFIKFFWDLIAESALARVRPGFDPVPLWVPSRLNPSTEAENERSRRIILKEKVELESTLNAGPRIAFPGITPQVITQLVAKVWFDTVRSHLNKLRNDQVIGDDQFVIQQMCRCWIEHQVTDKEITWLLADIRDRNWFQIPVVLCYLFLDGLIWYDMLKRSRRYSGNDEWDKYRAAGAFHCADCFVTDRGMASMLRQLKFDDFDLFQVFSVSEETGIIRYLSEALK